MAPVDAPDFRGAGRIITGAIEVDAFSNIARFTGLSTGAFNSLAAAPPNTFFANLYGVTGPLRPFAALEIAGLNLSYSTSLNNGPFPEVVDEGPQVVGTAVTSSSIPLFANILVGDRIVVGTYHNVASQVVTTPTGFTLRGTVTTTNGIVKIFERIWTATGNPNGNFTLATSIASSALVYLWQIRYSHPTQALELVSQLQNSVTTTNDLPILIPSWGTANTLYGVFIGIEDDAGPPNITAFPGGLDRSSQTQIVSATASIDGAIGWGWTQQRVNSADFNVFTYGPARSGAFAFAVPPAVSGAFDWDGMNFRVNGADANIRRNANFLSTTSIIPITAVDDFPNDETELKWERAALTGAITAAQNSNTTVFASAVAKSALVNATNAAGTPAFLAGTAANQYLRVNSANTGLEWGTLPAGGGTGWDDVLLVDPHSGASNPIVDDAQYLQFGIAAPPATGQIRTNEPFQINGDDKIEIFANDLITIKAPDTITVQSTGGSPVHLITSSTVHLESTGGQVSLNASTFVDVLNGFMRFGTEQAASTPSMSAGQSLLWPKNTATPGTEPFWTDDNNNDFPLFTSISENGAAPLNNFSRINFDDGTKILVTVADLGSRQANIIYSINPGSIALSDLVAVSAKSVLANATNASAVPTALAGSAAFQHLRVNSANTALEWSVLTAGDFPAGTVPLTGLATQATDTFVGNVSGSTASPTAVNISTLAGAGLVFGTHTLDVTAGAGASLVVGANDIQRGALTGAVTAAQDSNTTAFGVLAAKSVLANATNASAIPAALAGSAAFQHLRVNSTNNGLEWSLLTASDFPAGVIPTTALPAIPDQMVLGNDSGVSASPTPITVHQELDWIGGGSKQWVFDGVDDSVQFGNNLPFQRTDSFTLSCWVQASSNNNDYILAKIDAGTTARGYVIYFRTSAPAGVMFELNNDSNAGANCLKVYAANTIVDGNVHNVTVTYGGTSTPAGVKIYFDGVSQTLTTFLNTLSATTLNTGTLRLSEFVTGIAKHASIWNAALSALQVTELYNSGAPGNLLAHSAAANLKLWVKMDDLDAVGASGIIDYSTSALNGTAVGGLAPIGLTGSLPVRGPSIWQILAPGLTNQVLISQGPTSVPDYAFVANANMSTMTANTWKGNITAGTALPTDNSLATLAGAGLTYAAGVIDIGGSTSLVTSASDIQRAALTGAVTAAQNSNATAFGVLVAKSVLANATNASAIPAALVGSAAFQHLRVNSGNTALEWSVLTSGDFPAGTVPLTGMATQGAHTFVANNTAGTASPTAISATAATAELDLFSSTLKGLTPLSGGGTANFLRADGTWTAPPGTAAAHVIQDNSTSRTARANLNFDSTTSIVAAVTDDSVNNQSDVTMQRAALTGAVTAALNSNTTAFGTLAALSVLANATNAVAIPAALAGSAAFQHLRVNAAGTALEWSVFTAGDFPAAVVPLTGIATQATDTFVANVSGSTASPTAVNISTLAGAGLVFGTHTLDVTAGAGASLVVGANDIQRGALTGAVTATQDSNTTAFGVLAAKSVLANATNASAIPAALAGSAAFQHLRVNSANTALEWSVLTAGDFPAAVVPLTGLATQATDTFVGNVSGSTASPVAVNISTLAGAGLVFGTHTLDVTAGAGASLVVGANDIQRGALTGAVTATQDSNTTAFGVLAAKSVLANATNASAIPAALAGSAAFQHLRVNSGNTALEWSVLTSGDFPAGTVPLTGMATQGAHTFVANATAGVASPTAITATAATAELDVFNTVKGLVPGVASSTTNFLRADGTFAVPPGTGLTALPTISPGEFLGLANTAGGAATAAAITPNVAAGNLRFSTLIDTSITGTVNSYTGLADNTTFLRISAGSAVTLNGILAAPISGQRILVRFGASSSAVTINHLSGSAVAADQINMPGNVSRTFRAGDSFWMQYAESKWFVGPCSSGSLDMFEGGVLQGAAVSLNFNDGVDIQVDTSLTSGGFNVTPRFSRSPTVYSFWEDFDFFQPSTNSLAQTPGSFEFYWCGDGNWGGAVFNVAAGNINITRPAPVTNHPGVVTFTTAAATGSAFSFFRGRLSVDQIILANQVSVFECSVAFTDTLVDFYMGAFSDFSTAANVIAAQGIGFRYSPATGTSVVGHVKNATTISNTSFTGGFLPGTGFNTYKLVQGPAGTVQFFFNGTSMGTVNTNVPTTQGLNIGFFYRSNTTVAKALSLDYVKFESLTLTR